MTPEERAREAVVDGIVHAWPGRERIIAEAIRVAENDARKALVGRLAIHVADLEAVAANLGAHFNPDDPGATLREFSKAQWARMAGAVKGITAAIQEARDGAATR